MNRALAKAARAEAAKNFHGNTVAAIGNLQPLREYFDDVTAEELAEDWSGAFAYHCARLAGSALPPKYPDPRVSCGFWSVRAWWEYARLPKIGILRSPAEAPEIGDLAVFCLSDGKPVMGVVLNVEGELLELAVGDYRNHSAIAEKPMDAIEGYIRLEK